MAFMRTHWSLDGPKELRYGPAMEHDIKPLTPADFIRKQLEHRGMTQNDLAFVLEVPVQAVNQLALGRRGVSADMARALSVVFEVSAEYILGLQKSAELTVELARAKAPDPKVARNALLVSTYPVREMVKRGWLNDDRSTFETQLASFFGVRSTEELPHFAHAAKKSDYSAIPPAQLAWIFRVRQIAREMVVPRYSEAGLAEALAKLSTYRSEPEEARHIPRLMAECGVRFVVVQALPSAKIDGVCFWLNNGSPVIGMSLRFDRIDNFWFVLLHEIEHVLRRHGENQIMVDDLQEPRSSDDLPEEQAANAASLEFCVPQKELNAWIARKAPFYSDQDLIGFARRIGVHPGLVAGQLRARLNNYKLFTKHLAKIQSCILPAATTDGWGHLAPVAELEGI